MTPKWSLIESGIADLTLCRDITLILVGKGKGFVSQTEQSTAASISAWRLNLLVCTLGSFTTIVAMTLLLPFLPVYVEQLGVTDPAEIAELSGIAYGATFLTAGLTAPLWGILADRYGRKLMLIRASLGMAIAMSLMGMAHSVWQLVALRLAAGLLGGYSSGSMVLVAAQTPKGQTGWALGVLSGGIMAGNLVGPLVGGYAPEFIGIRATFLTSGCIIFITFIATAAFIREQPRPARPTLNLRNDSPPIAKNLPVKMMLLTGFLLMLANMSIEPIITLYVAEFVPPSKVVSVSGMVMSAAALGSALSAARLGRISDRVGHWKVVTVCLTLAAILLIPQAFVTNDWQLIALRFLMGLALGGLLPAISAVIRHNVPESLVGRVLGLSVSAQYAGQVIGPVAGGIVGGHIGMRAVFLATAVAMLSGAALNLLVQRQLRLAQH